MNWIRALAAASLSVVLPGAGHALLRDWGRAAVFGALFVTSMVLLLPLESLAAVSTDGGVDALPEAVTEGMSVIDTETGLLEQFTLYFLVLVAAVDAGLRGLGIADGTTGADDATGCPRCGKPLDDDLSFCHWCTARLEPDEEPAKP